MNASSQYWIVSLVLAALVSPGWAQSQPTDEQLRSRLITFKFKGGTAQEYIQAVKTASPKSSVLANPPELLQRVSIPTAELTDVTVRSALEVLEGEHVDRVGGRKIKLHVEVTSGMDSRGGQWVPAGEPVYRVLAESEGEPGRPDRSTSMTRVWAVTDLVSQGTSADDAMTAIEAALNLLGSGVAPAQIKFHEATNLLIVRGFPEQIDAVDQVVDQLRQSHRQAADEKARAAAAQRQGIMEQCELEKVAMQTEILKLQNQIERLHQELLKAGLSEAGEKK
jgi:hypothetical protein